MGAVGSKKKEYRFEKDNDQGSSGTENYFIERVVCQTDELQDGAMAEFDMGQDGKVLLVKENGVYSALGPKCTHYGAPLSKGVLIGGQIRCPWHGACFNSQTGDIEDFPGGDCLPRFEVIVEGNDVKVKASLAALKSSKRVKPVSKCSAANTTTFVVIGGGGAGQKCVETLRQEQFTGKIILISKEKFLPYDRPKLSKALEANASDLYLRKEDYYKQADITLLLETEVTAIDINEKWIECNGGKLMVKFDSLMIATGGQPLALDVPGSDLQNICYLRTPEDGNYIAKEAVGKAVVIIGSSFIGMEVASYLLTKARSIHIIGRSSVPFAVVFGEVIGKQVKAMFEERGVIFHADNSVVKFVGKDGAVTSVELSSGEVLEADICVAGIGVKPATDFLKNSGVELNEQGLIVVNEMLETNVKNIYAAGDIVEFPLMIFNGLRVNISHWQMALKHGRTVALNMLEKNTVLHTVPFFWSMMCGKSFRYAGYGAGFDDVIIQGNVEKLQFVAYYCKGPNVVAVCTINKDPEAAKFASCLSSGEMIQKSKIVA